MNKYLNYVIPVFLLLIIIEIIVDAVNGKKAFHFKDSVTNISLGLGQQVIEAFIKTLFLYIYLWVYQHSLFKIPDSVIIVLTVIFLHDFIYYWFHRLSHTINILWAIHIVHHQSNEYNFTVSLRQPWLHKFAALGFFLILPLLGIGLKTLIIAVAFQTFYQFWLHTKMINKIGFLEKILVTPSHHRVHHGVNDAYINKNFGNTFIIWDKLFGTFQPEMEPVVFGTREPFTSSNPVWANFHYWKEMYIKSGNKSGIVNRLKTLFMNPSSGFSSYTVETESRTISHAVSSQLKGYIVVQYVILISCAFIFLLNQDYFTFVTKSLMMVFFIWSTCSFSAMLDNKRNAILFEKIRVFVFLLLVIFLAIRLKT